MALSRLTLLINKLKKEILHTKIFRDSILSIIVRIGGKGFSFILRFFAIRLLGDFIIGVYSLSKDILDNIYRFAFLGLDVYFMRFLATKHTKEEKEYTYSYVVFVLFLVGFFINIALLLLSPFIAQNLLHKPEMTLPLQIISLSVIPWLFIGFYISALRGGGQIVSSHVFDTTLVPILSMILLFVFYKLGLTKYIFIYNLISVISVWIVVISIAIFFNRKHKLKFSTHINLKEPPRELFSFGGKVYILNIINNIANLLYAFIKGRYLNIIDIGVLATNKRFLSLLSVTSNGVYNSIIPDIVKAYEAKDYKKLKRVRYKALILALSIALPMTILMIVFKNFILSLFGNIYLKYSFVFLGQIGIGILTILYLPFEITLNMAKKQNVLIATAIIIKVVLRFFLGIFLLKSYGILGAVILDFLIEFLNMIVYFFMVEFKYKI